MKPAVQLSGQNGNVYNLLAICVRALTRAGATDVADALTERVTTAKSYDEALQAMMEVCNVS